MSEDRNLMMPLTGKVKRAKFGTVDIETKDGDTQRAGFTRPFMCGYYDGEDFYMTKGVNCIEQMLLLLLREETRGTVFYAHNGGGFDWLHFLPAIVARGYCIQMITVGSTIMMLEVKRSRDEKKKSWRFLDSMKLIPTSLKKAAKSFNTAVQKEEMDLHAHETDLRWPVYLKADCISNYLIVERFHDLVEETLGGEVGITAASTSMKTYRRSYQKAPIERHLKHHALFRDAYYGGRVEIHKASGTGIHYYDINSCYPYVMTRPQPVGKAFEWEGEAPKTLRQGKVGFARARVDYPHDVQIPVLPFRDVANKKLIFPVGRFEGTWDSEELYAAQKQGAKITWLDSVWIEAYPVLAEFVRVLYRYRDKSQPGYDQGLAEVCKILLNALYGRFGMKEQREAMLFLMPDEIAPDGARPAMPGDPDCRVWYQKEDVDSTSIVPQIAAHITAGARLRLAEFAQISVDRGGTLYYMDTDSVQTDADLSDICSTELGGIKDEGEGVTYIGDYIQPKLYCLTADAASNDLLDSWILSKRCKPEDAEKLRTKLAMKGYSQRSREQFGRVKRKETIHFSTLEKLGAMAARSFADPPKMRAIKRQLTSTDMKRTYNADGSTSPIILDNW